MPYYKNFSFTPLYYYFVYLKYYKKTFKIEYYYSIISIEARKWSNYFRKCNKF